MDYSQFLILKEELSLIAVIVILFVADLFMSPDAHKKDGNPRLNTMLPVVLLTIHTPVSYTHLDVYKRQVFYSHSDHTPHGTLGNVSAVYAFRHSRHLLPARLHLPGISTNHGLCRRYCGALRLLHPANQW